MKYLKSIFYGVLLLTILLCSVAIFLLTTTPGLYAVIKLANFNLPGKLQLKTLQGRLVDEANLAELSYVDDTVTIKLINAKLNWQLTALMRGKLIINSIHADKLLIAIKDTPKAIKKTADADFAFPQLPFKLVINDLAVATIQIDQAAVSRQFDTVHLQTVIDNERWVINKLAANFANYHLALHATGQPIAPYGLAGELSVTPIVSQQDTVTGKINVSGNLALYQWQGTFSGVAKGTVLGSLKAGYELSTQAKWHDARWRLNESNNLHSQQGQLTISGTLLDLVIKLQASFKTPIVADWQVNARIKNQKLTADSIIHSAQGDINSTFFFDEHSNFTGKLVSKNVNLSEFNLPITQLAFKTQFAGRAGQLLTAQTTLSTHYMENLLSADVDYRQKKLSGTMSLGLNNIKFSGSPPYQWQLSATLPQPSLLHSSLAGLKTTLSAKATLKSAQEGTLSLNVSPGVYQPPQEDREIPDIKFKGGQLTVNLSAKSLRATSLLTIDKQTFFKGSARLPKFRLDQPLSPKQPLEGTLNLKINSLDFLQGLSADLENLHGQLGVSLIASGTVKKPIINGELVLSNASVVIPKLSLSLNPIKAKLTSQNKQWKAEGSVATNDHSILFSGQGEFSPEIVGVINVNGDNFPVMKTPELSFTISPQLVISFKPQGIAINGSILIPSAQLKPISFSSSIDLSDDAVFVSNQAPTTTPLNITTDIQVKMGQDVALDVKGLHGFLDGELQVKQLPRGEPFAIGELTIRDGKYTAYGQDLVIEQGQLVFTGGLIANPAIRLRAVRYFKNTTSSFGGSNQLFDFNADNTQTVDFGNKTTVGVAVGGRLNTTKVTLFSIPPNLSQADILSMLILGRPANQASKSGAQLLLTAISSMNLDSGTKGLQLIDQLKQTLGFDINVQNTSSYNQKTNQVSDGTAFVVSKSLSKRLYLSYNIGIFEKNSNVFTLKYLLNQFFNIQVTASDSGNGIDLFYTHSKD